LNKNEINKIETREVLKTELEIKDDQLEVPIGKKNGLFGIRPVYKEREINRRL
jgi:RNA polymerase-interacting CarD/CdnL/TRCF family regulator